MRVWLLQRSEPTPHDFGGSQRSMRTGILAKMLAKQGHQVIWWTSTFDHFNHRHRYQKNIRKMVEDNYEIQYLYGCGYRKNVSFARMRDNVEVAQQFSALASSDPYPPDVIVASIPTAELALEATDYASQRSIPIFLDVRDLWPDVFFDLSPTFLLPAIKLLSIPMQKKLKQACKSATGIIGLTDAFVDWGVQHANRKRRDLDRVFPMGYLASNSCETDVEKDYQFWQHIGLIKNSNDLIVSFFGVLGKTNDLFPVLDAFRILKTRDVPVKCVICGNGEKAEVLKKKANSLNNVLFPGWVSASQIKALLRISDIGIAPYINSNNYINNIPNKPAEYLSGGLAIALSLSEGSLYKLLVGRRCGFTYENNAERLADTLEELINNPEKLAFMKANAISTFSELFNGDVVYGQLIRFIEQVVSRQNQFL